MTSHNLQKNKIKKKIIKIEIKTFNYFIYVHKTLSTHLIPKLYQHNSNPTTIPSILSPTTSTPKQVPTTIFRYCIRIIHPPQNRSISSKEIGDPIQIKCPFPIQTPTG